VDTTTLATTTPLTASKSTADERGRCWKWHACSLYVVTVVPVHLTGIFADVVTAALARLHWAVFVPGWMLHTRITLDVCTLTANVTYWTVWCVVLAMGWLCLDMLRGVVVTCTPKEW
jgi:hypothetical protein